MAAAACPVGKKDTILLDASLRGFGVRVTAGGAKVFLYQYRFGRVLRRLRLGAWPGLTTAQARRLAEQHRGAVHAGGDPVAVRRAAHAEIAAAEAAARAQATADALTVGVVIDQWQDGHLATRSASYRKAAPARLRAALAPWVEAPAASLVHADAIAALDAVKRDFGPVAANRVRAYARACFGWSHSRGTLPANPFASTLRPAQEVARDRVLSDAELARVWVAAGRLEDPWRAIVRLLILTGQRRSEVAAIRWAELVLAPPEAAVCSLPGARTKNGRAHDVPLSAPAVAILDALPRFAGVPFALSLGRATAPSGFGKAKARLDALLAEEAPLPAWTLHDLRRTVATGLQRRGTPLEITEAVLNHVSGSRGGIVGVYQRYAWAAEKRAALEAWAAHVVGLG